MMPHWVFIVGLSVFATLFIVVAWKQITIKQCLKRRYAGNPNVPEITFNPFNHSAKQTLIFFKFIAQKQYNCLNDAKLARDCNALRILYVCYLLVFGWVCFSVVLLPR